jgi:hypothetical protein
MTIRLENDTYRRFHELVVFRGATHNRLINMLIEQLIDGHCKCLNSRKPKSS